MAKSARDQWRKNFDFKRNFRHGWGRPKVSEHWEVKVKCRTTRTFTFVSWNAVLNFGAKMRAKGCTVYPAKKLYDDGGF